MDSIYNRLDSCVPDCHFHERIIAEIASAMRPKLYLELGVYMGDTFAKVEPFCGRALAVDISPKPPVLCNNNNYYQMTTDDFFLLLQDIFPRMEFDLVFIDADHSHLQSLKDFESVWPYVKNNGLVILHDTYPFMRFMTQPQWSGEVWKTSEWIKANMSSECEIVTIPVSPGLSVVRKCPSDKQVFWQL